MIPFVKTSTGLTVFAKNKSYDVLSTHPRYEDIKKALTRGDEDVFVKLVDVVTAVQTAINKSEAVGKVELKNGEVYHNGKVLHNVLTQRIIDLANEGLPIEPMCRFLENLMLNPSNRSVEELYQFLEHQHLPITVDGCFLAYKTVRGDFYSKAAGSLTLTKGKANDAGNIYNGVGEEIECPRNEVDDVANRTCSHGLHVGALAYAGPGGWYNGSSDNVVIVKVNPKDAVSVPSDHNAQKLRVCAYTVTGLYSGPLDSSLYQSTGEEFFKALDEYDDEDNHEWDEDEDIFEDYDSEEHIGVDDILVDDKVEFDYRKPDGEVSRRYVRVLEDKGSYFKCELLDGDHKGEARNFSKSGISDVTLYY